MPYFFLMLAYWVCVSRNHSPYVPEFSMSSCTAAWCISASCGQKWAPQDPGPGWWLAFLLLSRLLPASCHWRCWAERKANMQSQQISSQVYVKWSTWQSLANCSEWHRLPEVLWGTVRGARKPQAKCPDFAFSFSIPPQIKLVLPAHLPIQNYNFLCS